LTDQFWGFNSSHGNAPGDATYLVIQLRTAHIQPSLYITAAPG